MYSRPNPGQPGFNPMPSHAGPQPGQPGFNPIPQQPQYPGNGYAPTYPPQNTPGVPSYAPPPMPGPMPTGGAPVSFFHGQRVNIRLANGKYLRANPDGDFDGNADRPGDWERYTLEQQGNNLFALRTFHNKLACWDNGSKRFDVRDQAGEWERFEFQPAGNGGYFFYCPAHRCYINLVNGWLGSFSDPRQAQPVFVTVSNGGGGVAPQPFVPPPPQPFVPPPPQPFQGVRPGLYYIRNAHSKLLHVDFYFVSQAVGFEPDRRILVEAQPSQGPNRYALRNVTSGKVLCFDSSGRIESRDQIGPWEVAEFRPVPGVSGKFFIFNPAQNKYLRCSDSGAVDQSPVGQIWEQFEFLAA